MGQEVFSPRRTRLRTTLRVEGFLDQFGPYAVTEGYAPGVAEPGFRSRDHVTNWLRNLEPGDRDYFRTIRKELFLIFGVRSFPQIAEIAADPQKRTEVTQQFYSRVGKQYKIEGSPDEVKKHVDKFAVTADGVIDYVQRHVLNGQATITEMTNEVHHTHNPVDLLLIMFDPIHYNKRARFEAKRKLMLMEMAAEVDRAQRDQSPVDRLRDFDQFLERHVWKKDSKIGETETVFLSSTHDPDTFACKEVKIITPEEAEAKKAHIDPATELLTPVSRRLFTHKGRDIPVYITTRPKGDVEKILKMLRKRTGNTQVAVEDDIGFMGVFDSHRDLQAFQEALQEAQDREGLLPRPRDFSDTINGGKYDTGHAGSSQETQMRKSYVDLPDSSIEVILHTNQTYLDFYLRHGVGHDEFIINRLYDTGVVELLFPPVASTDPNDPGVFNINLEEARRNRIAQVRSGYRTMRSWN